MRDAHVTGRFRDQRSGAFRPFDDEDRAFRQVVLPTYREDVILTTKTVEDHMDQQGRQPLPGRCAPMLLNEAERR